MRWKPALNAFAITFGDRLPAAETYRAGDGPKLLTNTVGPIDDCQTDVSLGRYLQVRSEGSWTITITDF